MSKGHFINTQIICDEEGNIYDPHLYHICNLCHDITDRNSLKSERHRWLGQKLLICNDCRMGSPLIEGNGVEDGR